MTRTGSRPQQRVDGPATSSTVAATGLAISSAATQSTPRQRRGWGGCKRGSWDRFRPAINGNVTFATTLRQWANTQGGGRLVDALIRGATPRRRRQRQHLRPGPAPSVDSRAASPGLPPIALPLDSPFCVCRAEPRRRHGGRVAVHFQRGKQHIQSRRIDDDHSVDCCAPVSSRYSRSGPPPFMLRHRIRASSVS